jgi:hypothetical protein
MVCWLPDSHFIWHADCNHYARRLATDILAFCLSTYPTTMQSTTISLLTREGALSATFAPALSSEQYDQLSRELKRDGDTKAELTELLHQLAGAWRCRVIVDG